MAKQTIVLCILDGWGIGPEDDSNPIYTNNLPTIKYFEDNFLSGALKSSGISVGLPWGEEGNSEVGHLTIGSGRTLYQHFMRITQSIESGEFYKNEALVKAFDHAKENNSSVNLVGLLTEGNVHASIEHIEALLKMAKEQKQDKVFLHLFTDGRDSPPKSAKYLLEKLENIINEIGVGKIVDISGRHWAMDRDENWEKTESVYKILLGEGEKGSKEKAIEETYNKDLNDEYIKPTILEESHPIQDNDSVVFFNFREDRIRQISEPFINKDFEHFPTKEIENLFITTMTEYSDEFDAEVAFKREKVTNTLGEVLANNNKIQMRIGETVKAAHITYFFNGLREDPFPNEFRVLIPSEKVARQEKSPQMRARDITDRVLTSLREGTFDFILVNYANPDMIAHTGDYNATSEAIKIVDGELNKIVREVINNNHILIVTSDHGNAETVFDAQTGQPETKHNPNPVPFYLIGSQFQKKNNGGKLENVGVLTDIAPTILNIMNIPKPEEMTGDNLLDILYK